MNTYICSFLAAVCVVVPMPVSNTQFFGADGAQKRIGQLGGQKKLSDAHTHEDAEPWLTPLARQTTWRLKCSSLDTLPALSFSSGRPRVQMRGAVYPSKRKRKQRTRITLVYR